MAWAPDYVTAVEQKSYTRILDTVDDAEIGFAISAASQAINDHTNRQFGKVAAPEQRLYTARPDYDSGRWVVDIDDLQTTTGLVVTVTGVVATVTSFDLEPVNAVLKGMAWTRLAIRTDSVVQPTGALYEMAITAPWGWTTFPVPVKQAALLQTSRFLARRDSPYGIAGSPDVGSELRLLARLDPDVAVSLRSYRRARKVG